MTVIERHLSDVRLYDDGISPTINTAGGGGRIPMIAHGLDGYNQATEEEVAQPIRNGAAGGDSAPKVIAAVNASMISTDENGTAFTIRSRDYKGAQVVSYEEEKPETTETISTVRRLTPTECERLQGFPDGWTDIGDWVDSKGHKRSGDADTPRYAALGNSIAVGYANNKSGFWCWLMRRISAQYERQATLGSLFDGIGGFPLAWEACGGKAVWASEIEEFCIAVTKKRFPEDATEV